MNLDRVGLLSALNTVKPALASKDLVEELCHVWMDGKTMMAYNDAELGIQVPFKCPFTGGIRGALLLGLLSNSRAREITLEPSGEGVLKLKAARMRADLAVLDESRSIWQFPEPKTSNTFDITPEFIAGLKAVLVSVGNDTSIPEKLGVTMIFGEGAPVVLYTTDSKTVARVHLQKPLGNKPKKSTRIILPTAFCEQLLRLCAKGGFLDLRDDCAIAGNEDGVNIYARLIESQKPMDFAAVMDRHGTWPKGSIMEVPDRLGLALERMLVLLDGVPSAAIDFTIAEGRLTLEAEADGRGKIKDSIAVADKVPDVKLKADPAMIKRALPLATHMVFTADIIRLLDDKHGFTYIASTRT